MSLIKIFFMFVVGFASISGAFAGILDVPKKRTCESVNNWVGELIKLNGGGIPVKLYNGKVLGPRPSVYFVAKNLAPHMLSEDFSKYVGKPFEELTKKERKFISKYLMKCSGKDLIYVSVAFNAKKGSRDEKAWSYELENARKNIERLAEAEKQRSEADKLRYSGNKNKIAKNMGGNLDYVALSESKLGVKFGLFYVGYANLLHVIEVLPGGKADNSNIKEGMVILDVAGPDRYSGYNFRAHTESIFVDGISGVIEFEVKNLTNFKDGKGRVDLKLFHNDNKNRQKIAIYFDGESRDEYVQRKKLEQENKKRQEFSNLITRSQLFLFDDKHIVPSDEKNISRQYEMLSEKFVGVRCEPKCDVEIYDFNENMTAEFLLTGSGRDMLIINLNKPKEPKVLEAFRRTRGLLGAAKIDPSYLLAISDKEMLLSNYNMFKSPSDWENTFVAFATGYAKVCGSSTPGGTLIEITQEYSNAYSSSSHTHLVEKELFPAVKQFGIHRNDGLGTTANKIMELAVSDLGCQSKYVGNLRRNLLAFADQYISGKLVLVDSPGPLGLNVKNIAYESYKSLLNID